MDPSPQNLDAILAEAERLNFPYSSEPMTGSLLATLAASKPDGRILELGTGLGYGTSWLLSGLGPRAVLTTIEANTRNSQIAQNHLQDKRLRFVVRDAGPWLEEAPTNEFDLIFADSPEGKYAHLDDALRILKPGGLYVIDDMRRKHDGTDEYAEKAANLMAILRAHPKLALTEMIEWATGIVIASKM